LSASLLTASIRWAYFVDLVVDLVVDGQRQLGLICRQHPCRPMASVTLLDFLSSTLSLPASVRWTFFVNLVVDGQRQLGFLCQPHC